MGEFFLVRDIGVILSFLIFSIETAGGSHVDCFMKPLSGIKSYILNVNYTDCNVTNGIKIYPPFSGKVEGINGDVFFLTPDFAITILVQLIGLVGRYELFSRKSWTKN